MPKSSVRDSILASVDRVLTFITGRKAAFSIRAVNRMASLAQATDSSETATMRANIDQYKAESEKEDIEVGVLHSFP